MAGQRQDKLLAKEVNKKNGVFPLTKQLDIFKYVKKTTHFLMTKSGWQETF